MQQPNKIPGKNSPAARLIPYPVELGMK